MRTRSNLFNDKLLLVLLLMNPVIYVFELKKIIYGCESYWSFMKDSHDFEEIMELWKENDHESYRQWVHEKSMMERRIVKAFPMLMKHQGKEEKEDGKK